MEFDFEIRLVTGRRFRKSQMTREEWFSMYGEAIVIAFPKTGRLITHVCKPEVAAVVVDWKKAPYEFGERAAKGQPFKIFIHNEARSVGDYQPPRFGESRHVYAVTVGMLLEADKQVYAVQFNKDGKAIPSMRIFDHVSAVGAKL